MISQGWIRAVLLLIVYVTLSVAAGYFVPSTEMWITVSFLIAVGLVYLFRSLVDRKTFISIGFHRDRFIPESLKGFFLGSLLISAGTLVLYVLKHIEWIDIVPDFGLLLFNALLLLLVATGEELVFRGYILRNFVKSFNKWIALIISALLFTLVHVSNNAVPVLALLNTFLGGILLGLTFIHTRNLWMPVFFHFSWNFLQAPVFGFRVSGVEFQSLFVLQPKGNVFMSGGDYGFEASAICTILLILASALLIFREQQRPGRIKDYADRY